MNLLLPLIVCIATIITTAHGHARFLEPPSRSSMWRFGFKNPPDYDDNQGFCGGFNHQFKKCNGTCGICGNACDDNPKQHEAPGGKFANGIITRKYKAGEEIPVTIQITANHMGHMEFKFCQNNNIKQDPKQDCFDKKSNRLQIKGHGDKFIVKKDMLWANLTLALPDVECSQCIIQWTYIAGNNWGVCPDGKGRLGCGPQEHFRTCADVTIAKAVGYSDNSECNTFQGVGIYKAIPNISTWCSDNCGHYGVQNCPKEICECVDK